MACQPTTKTHDIAHEYLHRQPSVVVDEERKLFDEIMQAPFEGDHWQERYESEVEGWSDSDDDRVSSDSGPPDEAIVTPHRELPVTRLDRHDIRDVEAEERDRRALDAQRELAEMRKGAYWSTGGTEVEKLEVKDGWRSVSTGLSVASLSLALKGNLGNLGGASKVSTSTRSLSRSKARLIGSRRLPASSSNENCSLRSRTVLGLCSVSQWTPSVSYVSRCKVSINILSPDLARSSLITPPYFNTPLMQSRASCPHSSIAPVKRRPYDVSFARPSPRSDLPPHNHQARRHRHLPKLADLI